jgi:hypothetical protein
MTISHSSEFQFTKNNEEQQTITILTLLHLKLWERRWRHYHQYIIPLNFPKDSPLALEEPNSLFTLIIHLNREYAE